MAAAVVLMRCVCAAANLRTSPKSSFATVHDIHLQLAGDRLQYLTSDPRYFVQIVVNHAQKDGLLGLEALLHLRQLSTRAAASQQFARTPGANRNPGEQPLPTENTAQL